LRILHGTTDAANQAYYSVQGLREIGCNAENVRYTNSPLLLSADYELSIDKSSKTQLPLNICKILSFAKTAIARYDIFHFHYGRSLLPRNLDLPILNKLGKPYFFEYHGSEIRQGAHWANNPYAEFLPNYLENDSAVKRANFQLANARGAIVHDAEMGWYVPRGVDTFYIPLRMNVEQFSPSFPSEDPDRKPLIVHAPSRRGIKGSEYVEETLESLAEEYAFEYRLIENMSQNDAFRVYAQADIIIDQLFIGTYGVFALEAMAMGKPVVTYIRPDLRESFPRELPVVSASKDDLKGVTARLLESPFERNRLGRLGREYVEKYHDYRKVAYLLSDLYSKREAPKTASEAFRIVSRL